MGRCVNIVKKYEQDEKSDSSVWWNFHSRRHPAQTRIVMRHSVDCGGADESSISLHWKRVFFFFHFRYVFLFSTIKHPLVSGSLIDSSLNWYANNVRNKQATLGRTQQFSYSVWKNALKNQPVDGFPHLTLYRNVCYLLRHTTAAVTSAIRCTLDSLLTHFSFLISSTSSLFPVCVYSDYNREIWSCYFLFIVHLKNRVATSPPRDPEKCMKCTCWRFAVCIWGFWPANKQNVQTHESR